MNTEEIKTEIAKNKEMLESAFEKTDYPKDNPAVREGWMAWEWCRLQLESKGLKELEQKMMLLLWQSKAQRLGTYDAIQECLFGDQVTLFM